MIKFRRKCNVLAVASFGGHFEQLLLITSRCREFGLTIATTSPVTVEAGINEVIQLRDYNARTPHLLLVGLLETALLVLRLRPAVVISTGAAPGLLSLLWGRLLGAHTIWIDSVANAEKLSLSGQIASKFAHVTLTQWEHLAGKSVRFRGSVL